MREAVVPVCEIKKKKLLSFLSSCVRVAGLGHFWARVHMRSPPMAPPPPLRARGACYAIHDVSSCMNWRRVKQRRFSQMNVMRMKDGMEKGVRNVGILGCV